jgi:hypothetical protein
MRAVRQLVVGFPVRREVQQAETPELLLGEQVVESLLTGGAAHRFGGVLDQSSEGVDLIGAASPRGV